MKTYFQCRLSQGALRTVAWIEERGAKQGAKVELKDIDIEGESPETVDKFWTVDHVSEPGIIESVLRDKQSRDRNALPSIKDGAR